ncbi:MAG: ABC transporter ATP-binding protein [Candidatus Competibacteraceae bacterium]|uniref:Transport protein (ABC superfamily, atp_bind) n=1 Tax=Candidatus Contendobacter odensis Run_B_J11 TaxID=1400861 RepID=A0A7U7G7L0_9GAMM|nr:ABC transporter ATP-binding protein [Candidatus Contendobacter odensis]MBK8536814.1 ABC transporter ATP-binding protein [Candidatus Competibacteraceae bacterium]MBK8751089.1 ABC transporter ATP-binding protein [Candidatus Competibacteraceae bacterium]CDH43346.1 putative transport protein (ABC superfamily, atp_bind) [Candidatus Contendobacter odensis Run_B_J11]
MTTLALTLRGLRKTYTNGFNALRGIDLDVAEGEFFALLGPNGAGKSTTIGIVCSLVRKSSGTVQVFDQDLDRNPSAVKSYIGLVPQEFNFNQFEPVAEIVVNQAGYYGIPRPLAQQRAETYLRQLGLWEKRREIARELSGGMKRRLMIARALVHEPKLLILDEPTAGVDIEIRRSMWDFLRVINEQGTTIILTTHYLEEAEHLCRHIAIIDRGEIIENTRMQTLLGRLNLETFVLNLRQPLAETPEIPGYPLRRLDDLMLEVDVTQEQGINSLFQQLSARGIEISSLRNKTNRLEELFMRLVDKNEAAG